MKVLAFDSADGQCSVALYQDGEILGLEQADARNGLELMPQAAASLLAQAGLALGQLDRLAVGRGPGGFTGVRVAVGFVQGLALAAEIPVAAISSLAALAVPALDSSSARSVLSALDARNGELYVGEFKRDATGLPVAVGAEQLLAVNAAPAAFLPVAGRAGAGRGFGACPELAAQWALRPVFPEFRPRADAVARLGAAADQSLVAAVDLEPRYLRNQVAKPKSRRG